MLRDYQQTCVEATLNHLRYKDTNAIISAPTGCGKSHIIAALAEKLEGNILILAHRKELLLQNSEKFSEEVGLVSAGLNTKDYSKRITMAGIQTIANSYKNLTDIKYIIIDECHKVSNTETGQYWDVFHTFPDARLIGLSATPYRLDEGLLTWGDIVYNIAPKNLMDKGYLSPLVNKVGYEPDLSKVDISMGEYIISSLSLTMTEERVIKKSIEKILSYGEQRNSVLVFCIDIRHVNILSFALSAQRVRAATITGETPKKERERILEDFKAGKIKYLLNCEVLTTGFDAPNIDMIAVLRPTKSKSLHEQILGRGTRLNEGKENCLIIDLSGNLKEHGGLGAPFKGKAGQKKQPQTEKICPECESLIPIASKDCPDCGFHFVAETKEIEHEVNEDRETNLYNPIKKRWHKVDFCQFKKHISKRNTESLRIDFFCGYCRFSKWVVPLRQGKFAVQAQNLITKFNAKALMYDNYNEMADALQKNHNTPSEILVDESSNSFPEILNYDWEKAEDKEIEDEIPF